jgi:hypothetical protein
MLHRTSQERYEKLKRVFARLMERFNRDDLDDFIQTANSLREWIMQDDTLLPEQRAHLERFVVPESLDWQICHQIANAQKHVKANTRSKKPRNAYPAPAVTVAEVKHGAGFVVPPSSRIFGAGEEIVIQYDDKRESALGFTVRTFRQFHYIFEVAPIPIDKRVISDLMDILGVKE